MWKVLSENTENTVLLRESIYPPGPSVFDGAPPEIENMLNNLVEDKSVVRTILESTQDLTEGLDDEYRALWKEEGYWKFYKKNVGEFSIEYLTESWMSRRVPM